MVTLILLLALAQGGSAAAKQQETATIRGRVADKDTGAPLPRAIVSITRKDLSRTARTGDDGRFELVGLPPGEYMGFVEPPAHRATHLGQTLHSSHGLLSLKPGEVRDGLNVSLPRASALDVRVVDEHGGPLARVEIRLTDARTGAYAWRSAMRTTDDRGRLRAFGLARGRYIVCAEPPGMATSGENTSPKRERFLRTCFPSAENERTAEPVRLERTDGGELQIVMRRGRTFSISGIVVDSTGAPAPNARLSLDRFERNGSSGTGVRLEQDGSFRFTNVHAGDYALVAELDPKYQPDYRGPSEKSYFVLRLGPDSPDAEGVVIAMSRTIDVPGRFILEEPDVQLPPPPGSGLMIGAPFANDPLPGEGSRGHALADEKRAFLLERLFGPRLLDIANVPRGWYVKSIRYAGRDVFDTPTEFKEDASIEIVLSSRGASVTGRVLDQRGEPVRGIRTLMFPARKQRWGYHQRMTALTDDTGAFRLGPQRAGEYVIVALPPGVPVPDPKDYESTLALAEGAERIRLAENEERALDLFVRK